MKKQVFFLLAALLAIGQSAFAYDFSAVAPSGQTLYYNIVSGNAQVTSQNSSDPYYTTYPTGALTIPSSVTYGGTTYPVTSIGSYAFSSCISLEYIEMPNSVTSIGSYAFSSCISLEYIEMPNSVTSIGSYAFQYCSDLDYVYYDGTIAQWCNISFGNRYSNPTYYTHYLPNATDLNLIIPDNVTSIGNYAFYGCSDLTSVTIPNSVTSIGSYAFYGCSGLTSVTIGSGVTSIGGNAFRNCTGLTSVTIGSSVTSIGYDAFYGCTSLTSVTIPNSVISIGYETFYGCSGLTSVTIGSGVTSIGGSAFSGCSGLTSVTIPNSVTSIDYYAFYNCSGLTSVTIGSGVTSIGNNAFSGCSGLTSVTIPNSVTEIDSYTFSGCSSLTSVTIGSGVTEIGSSAFKNCTSLTSVTIPNSVTEIGSYAFSGCSGLTSVTIGSGVTEIWQYAFMGCSGLTSVTIPNSVTTISFRVFSGCTGLTSIVVASGNTVFDSRNNCNAIIETATNTLVTGCKNTIIPNTVTSIDSYAFHGCSGLTSITIPDSVTSIGTDAFYGCSSLDTVYMEPSTPPYLDGTDVFYNNASGRVFIIAGCAYDNYYNVDSSNPWYNLRNYLRRQTININVTVQSSNTARGTANVVLGPENHVVRCDSTVVVQATANSNYHFDHWSTGSTANPDTITLVGDSIITAYFLPNQYTITGTSDNTARGTVTGSATVDYLDTVTLTATANYGYHIDHWTYTNQNNNGTSTQTGGNTLTLVANKNRTATAYFSPNQYQLTLNVDNSSHGTVTGGGTYDYLTSHTISATASTGYHFDHWSNGTTSASTSITLMGDTTLTAYFERNSYNLTVNVNNTSLGTVATPDGSSALYQDTLIAVATPIDHHHVASWQGQNIVATSAHKDTVWVKMLNNRTLTCNFAIDTHTVAVATNDIARGMVDATGTEFVYGTPCTVTATAYTGYTFHSWSNGVTANPYTFAVLEDVELTAIFVTPDEETYTVSVNVNDPAMGSATVNGTTTASVISGGTVTLAATPNSGYRFLRWNDNDTHAVRTVTVTANATYTAYFISETQGITDITASDIVVYATDGRIVVEGTTDEVRVYDMMGRLTQSFKQSSNQALPSGVYLVKVGDLPARKVVVIR